jgi:hypothetical protein
MMEAFKEYKGHGAVVYPLDSENIREIEKEAFEAAWNIQQERIDHLNDLLFELEQNLLCAQDQNHYFKLMCKYRDKLHELQGKL